MRQIWKRPLLSLGIPLLLGMSAGCLTTEAAPPMEKTVPTEEIPVMARKLHIETEILSTEPEEKKGKLWSVAGTDPLDPEQEQLLLEYMDRYYQTLVRLEQEDITDLFAEEWQAAGDEAVWEYQTAVRSMQKVDLALTDYQYELICHKITPKENGALEILLVENNIQNFAEYPEIDATTYDITHLFEIVPADEGWKILSHKQAGSLYQLVQGEMFHQKEPDSHFLQERVSSLLTQAEREVGGRDFQGKEQLQQAEFPYDREAAVSYAREWVGKRNEDWPDYSFYGGNCQNFVSQSLFAGGIPMDIEGRDQWKWYGSQPNMSSAAVGRSSSWSGVEEFLSYMQQNRGYGLVAATDAPFYSGRPGDLIHLGTEEEWNHTVIITDVITDENGETIDYLVSSNTMDLKNFPVSAYHYTRQMLIQIGGWNR